MGNNEIMFNGRSLGFFKEEEIQDYTEDLKTDESV